MKCGSRWSGFLISIVLLLPSCASKQNTRPCCRGRHARIEVFDPKAMPIAGKPITIFIHGTRILPPLMLFCPYIAFQVVSPSGLHRVINVSSVYYKRRIACLLSELDKAQFPRENFYLFGWSGELGFKARERAGERLYHLIRQIRDNKALEHTPITIIAHSHGGNVALNVAAAAQKYHDATLVIDRLIMGACPIQEATQDYVYSGVFKRIYNLFSTGDMFQVLDPQSLYPWCEVRCKPSCWLSERRFRRRVPYIVQAEISNGDRTLSHTDFGNICFYSKLPHIIQCLDDQEKTQKSAPNDPCIYSIDMAKM